MHDYVLLQYYIPHKTSFGLVLARCCVVILGGVDEFVERCHLVAHFFFGGGGTLGMYFVGTCWDPGHHWDWQSNVWNLDKAWFFVGGKIWLMESSTWVYWVYNYRSQSSNKKQLFHSRPPVTWASALDGSFCLTSTDGAGGPIWVIKTLRGWVVSRTIWDVTNLGVIPCNGYSLQNSCVGYFMIISFFTNLKENT